MTLKLYDRVCLNCSRLITQAYSTSFSMGILCFDPKLREPIYSIYGFVRLADEIVDTFHGYDKENLLSRFREDTYTAINDGISLNPVLHNFQKTVNFYNIDHSLIDQFLKSMEMDLSMSSYEEKEFAEYIVGSAEVVGLMCLKVFCAFGEADYEKLSSGARHLGAAFQKVNFLRDLRADYEGLGRIYFPELNIERFNVSEKSLIEADIEHDFKEAYKSIKLLPPAARFGVYLAYVYYLQLFKKIKKTPPANIMKARIRIPNQQKYSLVFTSYLRHCFNLL